MDMKERLQELAEAAGKRISESEGLEKLNEVRVAYLGKKGELTAILKSMKDVAPEERPKVGQLVNETRSKIEALLDESKQKLEEAAREEKMKQEVIDVTLPAKKAKIGHRHPNTIALEEVERIFIVDATHSPSFHQIEGLVIDKNITFADLKGTLQEFAQELFGPETKTKFRPHHFPFTEPSAEVDVSCFKCGGKGCRFCKGSGWIEILGCGMVHPNVLSMCGIDPEEYTGFAFGVGLERIALLKYEIDDMRLLYENDIRFLKQF